MRRGASLAAMPDDADGEPLAGAAALDAAQVVDCEADHQNPW